jgi:branched-chain amino acid transport system substrate-binding protein
MYKNHNIVFFKFHKAVFISACLLLVILLLFNFSACESKEKVIKIGNQSVLSGEDKFYGEDQLISLSMAAAELSPVRIGGFDYTIELVTKDDEGNAEKAFLIAQELVEENAVAVIGSTFNGTTKSSIPVYSEQNIPFITPSAPGEDVSRGYQNFYRMIINNSQKIENIANFLNDDIKPEKLILIDNGEDYSVKLIDYIIEIFDNKKISFNKRYSVKFDSAEYDMLAENLLIDEPDVIFFCAKSNELADLITKTRKLQLNCSYITEEMGMEEGVTDDADKTELEGLIAIVPQPPSLAKYTEDKKSIDFWRKYTDFAAKMKPPTLSKEGPGSFAPYSYDAFYILINAMKAANSISPEDYSVELKKTSYAGITGQIAFNSNGDRLNPQSTEFIMKNGDWIRYSQ